MGGDDLPRLIWRELGERQNPLQQFTHVSVSEFTARQISEAAGAGASQTHPGTRYSLIGASAILAELQALHLRPFPSLHTIERVLERNGVTVPKVRLAHRRA